MRSTPVIRLYALFVLALLVGAVPASAQFTLWNEGASGELYHVEFSAGYWFPSAHMTIESEYLGIVGSNIDLKKDLGLTDQRFNELHVVGRLSPKHKLRFEYIPMLYDQSAKLTKDIVFRAQRYRVGLPVNSQLDWKAYRFAYEYDFITRDKGFGGFIVDAKYTDVKAGLQSPVLNEFIHARAPIPTLGGIVRYYFVPNVSLTGELTGISIPDVISKEYKAHYLDLDIYGTLNFTKNIGGQFGYRTFDVGYLVEKDTGSFNLRGIYFGIVARY
jgi:hypothetical protein